jgi:hypothetical protein
MNTPGCLATKLNLWVLPGSIDLKALFGATSEEWKSIECGNFTSIFFEAPFTRVISTLSPCSTTIGVETPVPRCSTSLTPKDHTRVAGFSFETLVTCSNTSTLNLLTGPAGTAGRVGSGRL